LYQNNEEILMKRKIITQYELNILPDNEFKTFKIALDAKAFRLVGIPWTKWIQYHRDINTNDLIFEYE